MRPRAIESYRRSRACGCTTTLRVGHRTSNATLTSDSGQARYLDSDGTVCPAGGGESSNVTDRIPTSTAPSAAAAKCNDSSAITFNGGNLFKESRDLDAAVGLAWQRRFTALRRADAHARRLRRLRGGGPPPPRLPSASTRPQDLHHHGRALRFPSRSSTASTSAARLGCASLNAPAPSAARATARGRTTL